MRNITLNQEQYDTVIAALITGKVCAAMGARAFKADNCPTVAAGFDADAKEIEAAMDTLQRAYVFRNEA